MDADLKIVRPSFAVSNTDASFDVSVTDATYDVSYVKATYELASTTATFEVSNLAASFVVSYTNITPTVIELGIFLLRHTAIDAAALTDFTSLILSKGLLEEVSSTELLTMATTRPLADSALFDDSIDRLALSKSLQNISVASELIDVSPGKGLYDTANINDLLARQVDFVRLFADEGAVTDLELFNLGKNSADAAAVGDSLAFETVYLRDYADFAAFNAANDIILLAPTKVLSETVGQADTITFDVSTNLYDSLSATDDFDGEAVLDDDQTITFTKVTVDLGSVADSPALQVGYDREFLEAVGTTDLTTFSSDKTLSELVLQSEQLTFDTALDRQETADVNDAASVLFATDVSDNGYTSDSNVKSVGIANSDSASIADSGLLYGTDYVDNLFYFAEDYVGFSRNF